MKTRDEEYSLTVEQFKNLLKSNPYFSAENAAYTFFLKLSPKSEDKPQSPFTPEQVKNLLKNPSFAAEQEAYKSTRAKI